MDNNEYLEDFLDDIDIGLTQMLKQANAEVAKTSFNHGRYEKPYTSLTPGSDTQINPCPSTSAVPVSQQLQNVPRILKVRASGLHACRAAASSAVTGNKRSFEETTPEVPKVMGPPRLVRRTSFSINADSPGADPYVSKCVESTDAAMERVKKQLNQYCLKFKEKPGCNGARQSYIPIDQVKDDLASIFGPDNVETFETSRKPEQVIDATSSSDRYGKTKFEGVFTDSIILRVTFPNGKVVEHFGLGTAVMFGTKMDILANGPKSAQSNALKRAAECLGRAFRVE